MVKENIFFCGGEEKGREKEKQEKIILLTSQGVQILQCGQGSKVDGQDCQDGCSWQSKCQFGQQGVQQLFPPIMKMTPPLGKIIPSQDHTSYLSFLSDPY